MPQDLEQLSDEELIDRCQDLGDDQFEGAFEVLYLRYRDRAYSVAFRITGKAGEAMEVVQDAFGLVFRKIGDFRGDSHFNTWLFRIVVNCAINLQRETKRHNGKLRSLAQISEQSEPVTDEQGPANHAESSELGDHVHQALLQLSPKMRAVLVLRYLEGLSYEQLTVALEVSMGTVKSRLARAHTALENILRGTLAPFGYPEIDLPDGQEGVA